MELLRRREAQLQAGRGGSGEKRGASGIRSARLLLWLPVTLEHEAGRAEDPVFVVDIRLLGLFGLQLNKTYRWSQN